MAIYRQRTFGEPAEWEWLSSVFGDQWIELKRPIFRNNLASRVGCSWLLFLLYGWCPCIPWSVERRIIFGVMPYVVTIPSTEPYISTYFEKPLACNVSVGEGEREGGRMEERKKGEVEERPAKLNLRGRREVFELELELELIRSKMLQTTSMLQPERKSNVEAYASFRELILQGSCEWKIINTLLLAICWCFFAIEEYILIWSNVVYASRIAIGVCTETQTLMPSCVWPKLEG